MVAAVLCAPVAATAEPSGAPPQATDKVAASVRAFLANRNAEIGQRREISVDTSQSNRAPCRRPEPFLPNRSGATTGQVTVGLRCPGDQPATRYVLARVRVYGNYYVAAGDIASGTQLTAADIAPREGEITRNVDRLPGPRDAIVGQQARRRIGDSQMIVSNMLEEPSIINRGDRVEIRAKGQGFSITTRGEALDDAAKGEMLRVRTQNSAVIEARPVRAGVVVAN